MKLLLRSHGVTLEQRQISNAASLRDWLGALPHLDCAYPHTGTTARLGRVELWLDFGDGVLRRVFCNTWPASASLGHYAGEPRLTVANAENLWSGVIQTVQDELTRVPPDPLDAPPRYRNWSDAARDGWQVVCDTVEHRGWLILTQYRGDVLRVEIRERSGHGDRGLKFRRCRPPPRPVAHSVRVDQAINKRGNQHKLLRLVRTADYLTLLAECRNRVDAKIDGKRNLDLVEKW